MSHLVNGGKSGQRKTDDFPVVIHIIVWVVMES